MFEIGSCYLRNPGLHRDELCELVYLRTMDLDNRVGRISMHAR
jgi:hypothetical protein